MWGSCHACRWNSGLEYASVTDSALEVDLTGRVCSDSLGYRFYSGIGGQVDWEQTAHQLWDDGGASMHVRSVEQQVIGVDAGEPDSVGLMIDYWFGKGAFTRLPDPVRGYLNLNAPRNVLDVRSSFAAHTTADQLGALKMPVLMVWGDRSPEVIPAMGRALQKLVPGARVDAIAGGNHGMLDFHPEAVARYAAG